MSDANRMRMTTHEWHDKALVNLSHHLSAHELDLARGMFADDFIANPHHPSHTVGVDQFTLDSKMKYFKAHPNQLHLGPIAMSHIEHEVQKHINTRA